MYSVARHFLIIECATQRLQVNKYTNEFKLVCEHPESKLLVHHMTYRMSIIHSYRTKPMQEPLKLQTLMTYTQENSFAGSRHAREVMQYLKQQYGHVYPTVYRA
jgi:hypothetical protein